MARKRQRRLSTTSTNSNDIELPSLNQVSTTGSTAQPSQLDSGSTTAINDSVEVEVIANNDSNVTRVDKTVPRYTHTKAGKEIYPWHLHFLTRYPWLQYIKESKRASCSYPVCDW